MESLDYTRFVLAFVFVLSLIGLLAYAAKRYTSSQKLFGMKEGAGRISIVETRYLDPRRKLVLVKRDDAEHLILLAEGRELVVESNIIPPARNP